MTPRSTTLRTEGCKSLEKGVEQAPEQPWKPRPRRYSPEQPLGWRWGWKKALGWEQWNTRSAEEGQTIAQPQHLYTPVSAPLPLQACQWRDREPPERVRKETAPTSWNPKARKKEPTPPPAPLWSAYNHQDTGGRGALPGRSAIRKRIASRGTPEGQPAAIHRVETAGVPKLAEETHQGGSARGDNTRSSRRKRRDSTSATEVMPPKQTEQKPPEKVGCSSDPQGQITN